MGVPQALRVLRLRPGKKYCTVGRLVHEFGWKYRDIVEKLEERRKVKGQAYYERKRAAQKMLQDAKATRTSARRPGSSSSSTATRCSNRPLVADYLSDGAGFRWGAIRNA